jgi:hypothetical protein
MTAPARWRSAKRPPSHEDDVFVYLPADELRLIGCHYEDDERATWFVYGISDYGRECTVTHWQPLPAPPRTRKVKK